MDALKALGIFAIYLGHFGKAGGKFYLFVFEYHVPLFFFASGLFAASSKAKSIWEYTRDKFVRIMLPYFAFSMIHLVFTAVQYDYNAHQTTDALWKILWGIRNKTPAAPLWFLPCMFVLSVLFFVLKKLLRYDVLIVVVAFAIKPFLHFPEPSWFWNIDSALSYLIFYAIGAISLFFLNRLKEGPRSRRGKALFAASVVGTFLFMAMAYFKNSYYPFIYLQIVLPPFVSMLYGVFKTLVLIYANVLLAFCLSNIQLICAVGRSTLILCGFESLGKTLVQSVCALFDLGPNLANPLITVLYTAICLMCVYWIGVPIYNGAIAPLLSRFIGPFHREGKSRQKEVAVQE